ncbi:MAG: hypothetical protein IJB11_04795 [Oscillospiraceae bacterium]|nr:hypothetical protein [Oscillospiraceae bacterium]
MNSALQRFGAADMYVVGGHVLTMGKNPPEESRNFAQTPKIAIVKYADYARSVIDIFPDLCYNHYTKKWVTLRPRLLLCFGRHGG